MKSRKSSEYYKDQTLTHIYDNFDSRIELYKVMTLRHNIRQSNLDGAFIADGKKVVETLLRSSTDILSIFAVPKFYDEYSELITARNLPPDKLLTASPEIMESITGFRHHSGVMAIGATPPLAKFDELEYPAVGLSGVINPDNVGAIIRNCAGLGFRSLVFDAATCSPYLRRSVRVSMGAALNLKICRVESIAESLEKSLKYQKPYVVGAEIVAEAVAPDEIPWRADTLILFGGESRGISRKDLAACDAYTAIPVLQSVKSLNVAAASAVVLYSALKKINTKIL